MNSANVQRALDEITGALVGLEFAVQALILEHPDPSAVLDRLNRLTVQPPPLKPNQLTMFDRISENFRVTATQAVAKAKR